MNFMENLEHVPITQKLRYKMAQRFNLDFKKRKALIPRWVQAYIIVFFFLTFRWKKFDLYF